MNVEYIFLAKGHQFRLQAARRHKHTHTHLNRNPNSTSLTRVNAFKFYWLILTVENPLDLIYVINVIIVLSSLLTRSQWNTLCRTNFVYAINAKSTKLIILEMLNVFINSHSHCHYFKCIAFVFFFVFPFSFDAH